MSNPPNGYNTDVSFNKFKGSYFNDDVDVSGGDIISRTGNLYLAPNSSIFTESNQIQFNEEFQFTDFIDNVNVMGQLKNSYNSVSYDVGLQCEKTDTLVDDVATLSPIVSDTAYKCTGFYWDAGLSSTIFNNNASFPNASISSTAINNTSFVSKSGAETIDGIKTFNSAPVMSGAGITTGTIPVNRVTGSAVNLSTAQSITSTKSYSVVQNFNNNIRLDGSLIVNNNTQTISNSQLQAIPDISTLKTITTAINYTPATVTTVISNVLQFTGTLNGWNTTNFSNAINYAKDLTSSAQTQINNINGVVLSASNVFTGATNQFSNTLRLDGSLSLNANTLTLTNANLQKIQYLSTVSSDIQTQTTTNASNITTANTNISTLTTKLTDVSFASSITTVANTLASSIFTFSTSINGTTKAVFDNVMLYCNTLSGNVQTALTNLSYSVNPVASIIMSPMSDIQTTSGNKYLLCDGQSVGRSSYPNLFAKIGTTFGSQDPFTFNVPNYQGAFLRGYGQAMVNGQIYEGNYTTNTPQQDAIQEHRHWGQTGSYCGSNRASGVTNAFASGGFYPQTYNFDQTGLQSSGRSDAGETRPMNYSVYYYIKS